MKKLIVFFVMLQLTAKSQIINLENTYTQAPYFILTQISPSNYKYILFDPFNSQFKVYNLNHSLYASVNIPLTYVQGSSQYYINFVTTSLFDCDSTNLEYSIMFLGNGGPAYPAPYFSVYRANGPLLQKIDSVRFTNWSTGMNYATNINAVPIIKTPAGSKLILNKVNSSGGTAGTSVYALCGTMPTNYYSSQLLDEAELPFPNPTAKTISLPYKLVGETHGKLVIYSIEGKSLKEFQIDNNFDHLILNTEDLSEGTYLYSVFSGSGKSEGLRFTVAR